MDQPATKKDLNRVEENLSHRIGKVEKDVSGLKKDVSGLKEDVTGLKKDVSGLKKDVKRLDKKMDQMKDEIIKGVGDLIHESVIPLIDKVDNKNKDNQDSIDDHIHQLDRHDDQLFDHEKRITSLESAVA